MTINLTFLDNTSGVQPLFEGIQTNGGPWFGGVLLMFVFLILLLVFRRSGTQDAFLASSFVTALVSGLLLAVGILPGWTITIPFTMLVVSIVVKVWGDG